MKQILNWKSDTSATIETNPTYAKSYSALRNISPSLPSVHHAEFVVNEGESKALPFILETAGIFVLDMTLKANSTLTLTCVNRMSIQDSSIAIVRMHLGKGASVTTEIGIFGGSYTGLFLETHLDGENSSIKEHTVFWGDGKQQFELRSETLHHAPHTHAHIAANGIANNEAAVRFDGKIHITQPAKGSVARLNEHTLLLSPGARMNAIPGLTIDTNDVVATHAASMTRIDDEQLFYCESRGIPRTEGMRLIAEGFLKSNDVSSDFLDQIDPLIQEKLCRL